MNSEVLSDVSLARRLERAEALANRDFVQARSRLVPGADGKWMEIAGAYAMYDGPRSPSTQTFCLGLFQMPTEAEMETLEAFFSDRGAPVLHEMSPLADKALVPLLNGRGYLPVEFTTVMFLPLNTRGSALKTRSDQIRVRMVGEDDQDSWARTAAEGWREFTEIADLMFDALRVAAAVESLTPFLAEWDHVPIAAGALSIYDGVALFAGASTIPVWRHRGAQTALLESRLEYATRAGCDLAMMCAAPGSASQRNAERQGFRIAYTRMKWAR